MARVVCPKCGAVAQVVRLSGGKIRSVFGEDFVRCKDKAGGGGRLLGDCSEIEKAITVAIASGRV